MTNVCSRYVCGNVVRTEGLITAITSSYVANNEPSQIHLLMLMILRKLNEIGLCDCYGWFLDGRLVWEHLYSNYRFVHSIRPAILRRNSVISAVSSPNVFRCCTKWKTQQIYPVNIFECAMGVCVHIEMKHRTELLTSIGEHWSLNCEWMHRYDELVSNEFRCSATFFDPNTELLHVSRTNDAKNLIHLIVTLRARAMFVARKRECELLIIVPSTKSLDPINAKNVSWPFTRFTRTLVTFTRMQSVCLLIRIGYW